jgi:CRP-like cAMP-binding protein
MNERELVKKFREIGFLQDVAEEHLKQLAAVSQFVELPEGKVVFRQGEPASHIFVVVSGKVSLELCAPSIGCRRILTVGEGELLGWSPVLEQTLTATARTMTPVETIEINAGQIITMCEHDTRFGYFIMRHVALSLAKRLNATRMQLFDAFANEMPAVSDASEDEK